MLGSLWCNDLHPILAVEESWGMPALGVVAKVTYLEI